MGEVDFDMVVEFWFDGELKKEVEINGENFFIFDNKFVFESEEISLGDYEFEVWCCGWGFVYFNVYLMNFIIEVFIEKMGFEVKVEWKYYKFVFVDKEIEVVGVCG